MADTSVIPHRNVPTTDIGLPKLKEAVMLFNENFNALDGAVTSNSTAVSNLDSSKADVDHTHDAYADKDHTHSMQDVNLLQENLDLKAPLVHTHEQYLTEVPVHSHAESEVDGLLSDLANKSNVGHTHGIQDVQSLDVALSSKAESSDLAAVSVIASNAATAAASAVQTANSALETANSKADVGSSTPGKDTEDGSAGTATSTSCSRDDHSHPLNYPTGKPTTNMRRDGAGSNGTAKFGSTNNYADLGHSHPLDVPTSSDEIELAKQAIALTKDGIGSDSSINYAALGTTSFYARLDHIHALNVGTDAPPDISTSSGSAGDSKIYARSNHTHKMPALAATDITYGETTVGAKLANHEGRIDTLENRPSGGSVTSVDGVGPTEGDVVLNALTTTNYSTTLDSAYQAKSSKLTSLESALNSDGTMPVSNIHDDACTKSCLVICTSGAFGHSNSGLGVADDFTPADFGGDWPVLQAMSQCFTKVGNALRVLFSKVSAGTQNTNRVITSDQNGNIATNAAGDGLQVSNGVLKAKAHTNITVDANGISVSGVSGTGFVKSTNGTLGVPTDQPIALSSSDTGLVYNTKGVVSYKGIGSASGVAGLDSSSKVPIANIPVGSDQSSVAAGNHTHSGYASSSHTHGNITSDGKIASSADHIIVGGTNGVLTCGSLSKPQGYQESDLTYLGSIAALFDYANNNFTLSTAKLKYPANSGHSQNCLLVVGNDGLVTHSGNDMYDALNAVKTDYAAQNPKAIPYAKFNGTHNTEKFVKTNTDGQLVESEDTPLTDDNLGDGLKYDTTTEKASVAVKSGGGIAIDATTKDLKIDTSASGATTIDCGGFKDNNRKADAPGGVLWTAGGTEDATLLLVYKGYQGEGGNTYLCSCKLTISPFGTIKQIEGIEKGGISFIY